MAKKKINLSEYLSLYVKSLSYWILISLATGIICGLVGALFYNGVVYATHLRNNMPLLMFLLPVAGLLIVYIYQTFDLKGVGTNTIIDTVRTGKKMRIRLIPAIFIGTILTHLCGGSAGREGAALQIGADIGNHVGRLVHLKKEELRIETMMGMAGFFSAVFGTPLTATIFVVMFINVGHVMEMAVLPCFISAWTAMQIAMQFGVKPFRMTIVEPSEDPLLMIRIMALAALCGLGATLMIKVFHGTGKAYGHFFHNPYARILAGSFLLLLLTRLVGNQDYNGIGEEVIIGALQEGKTAPLAFLLKIVFTAVTLEAGFKGGEIVPTFFIGSTLGATIGPLLGVDPRYAAAIGLVSVFGAATNTLIAPIFLAVEVFGTSNIASFALAAVMAYICSGYSGLYSSQIIMFSKVSARPLGVSANSGELVKQRNPRAVIRLFRTKTRKSLHSTKNANRLMWLDDLKKKYDEVGVFPHPEDRYAPTETKEEQEEALDSDS